MASNGWVMVASDDGKMLLATAPVVETKRCDSKTLHPPERKKCVHEWTTTSCSVSCNKLICTKCDRIIDRPWCRCGAWGVKEAGWIACGSKCPGPNPEKITLMCMWKPWLRPFHPSTPPPSGTSTECVICLNGRNTYGLCPDGTKYRCLFCSFSTDASRVPRNPMRLYNLLHMYNWFAVNRYISSCRDR